MSARGWLLGVSAAAVLGGCHLFLGIEDDLTFDRGLGAGGSGGDGTSGGGAGGPSAGGGGAAGSGGGGCSWMPVEEEFDAPIVHGRGGWQLLNDGGTKIESGGSVLVIQPDDTEDFWWNNAIAPSVVRQVCGNFGLHVHVVVTDPSTGLEPSVAFHGAGIVARNPEPPGGDEHWALFTHASHDRNSPDFETTLFYSPADEQSGGYDYQGAAAQANGADLVLCRVGDTLAGWRWEDGGGGPELVFQDVPPHAELPDVVQLGVTAHRFYASEEVKGEVWFANYFQPSSLQECEDTIANSCVYVPSNCP